MFREIFIAPHFILKDSLKELLNNIPFFLTTSIANLLPKANLSLFFILTLLIFEYIFIGKRFLI